MIATCKDTSQCVQLADSHIESARSIGGVLQIIALIEENDQTILHWNIPEYMCPAVVLFAQKYDMKLVLATIKSHLFRLSAEYPPSGAEYFLEAARMSEWALCGRLTASFVQDPWQSQEVRKMLDTRGWTPGIMDDLTRVSTRFAWAVCQTGTKHGNRGSGLNYISYDSMREDLARLMSM